MITLEQVTKAKQCLIDNGIDIDKADTVLQALGHILMNKELPGLFKEFSEVSTNF